MWTHNGWQWLLLISLKQLYLPLTWDLARSKFTVLLGWLKSLGDGLGHSIWWAAFMGSWGCTRIQKKKQELFKQCESPKMATWGILSEWVTYTLIEKIIFLIPPRTCCLFGPTRLVSAGGEASWCPLKVRCWWCASSFPQALCFCLNSPLFLFWQYWSLNSGPCAY
jgi:hypothetical protein